MITAADFPAPLLEERTCPKCGAAFMAETRRLICAECRKPKPRVKSKPVKELSFREKQVADLTSQGMQTKEIAWQLKLTPGTVKAYLKNIYQKTGVNNRAGLAGYWVRQQMTVIQETSAPGHIEGTF